MDKTINESQENLAIPEVQTHFIIFLVTFILGVIMHSVLT